MPDNGVQSVGTRIGPDPQGEYANIKRGRGGEDAVQPPPVPSRMGIVTPEKLDEARDKSAMRYKTTPKNKVRNKQGDYYKEYM